MKNLIVITLIVLLSSCNHKYNYRIKDERGRVYLLNYYTKTGDGCILFNDKPGVYSMEGYPTRLCGKYKIKKLK